MIPRGIRLWVFSALLLSQVPGCVPLHGPSTVMGTVGESLNVSCQYEEKFKTNNKYWCRVSHILVCEDTVTTKSSLEEARNARVSFRDNPDNLTFTVTLEKLTLEDAGSYWCVVGIQLPFGHLKTEDFLQTNEFFEIEMSVVPGSSPWNGTDVLESPTSSPVHTQPRVTTDDTIAAPSPQPRSLLSSFHFCVLVFLELPLFLCMLAAVLWVNRPQRCSGGSSTGTCYENQ
ncbi:CMRF35-like molecule 6 [Mastomys coucha]|uniref:CMRF35-like molecule 6 n=1 Tax=Mastomys coucha TaxID=35658 RepID=UPI001261DC0C|nr:CMRF35-like molecule 6 [Mastomys coucha]